MDGLEATRCAWRHLSLIDVLHGLSLPVLDRMVAYWKGNYCLSEVRLSCRGLREVVDNSLTSISINLDALRLWRLGQLPSIGRWPRCSTVAFFYGVTDNISAADAASLFMVPFAGLSLEARQRITYMSIKELVIERPSEDSGDEATEEEYCVVPESAAIVALLAQRLPGLRELDLSMLLGLSCKRLPQQVMYGALAYLPHLERLILPRCTALKCVGTLAGSSGTGSKLKYLELGTYHDNSVYLKPSALTSLVRLGSLQQLCLKYCTLQALPDPEDAYPARKQVLLQLLRSLPPSLQLLHLEACLLDGSLLDTPQDACTFDAEIHMSNSQVKVKLATTVGDLVELAQYRFLQCILDWHLQQQQQREGVQQEPVCLTFGPVSVSSLVPEAEMVQLRALLPRFSLEQVPWLRLRSEATLASVQQAVGLLGTTKKIQIVFPECWAELNYDRMGTFQVARCRSTPFADGLQKQQPPQQLPSAEELLQRALARITAVEPTVPGVRPSRRAFMLQGPYVASLTHGSVDMQEWMQLLHARAAGVAGSKGCAIRCERLEFATAIIVGCSEGRAPSVAEAATAIAEAAGPTVGTVKVVPVTASLDAYLEQNSLGRGIFREALCQEIQAALDAAAPEPSGARDSFDHQLAWLLGLREQLVLQREDRFYAHES